MLFGRKKKKPIVIADKKVQEWKYAVCGYCSTGCSLEVGVNEAGRPVATRGVGDGKVNQGKLCIKGIFEHELSESSGRGDKPLMRDKIYDDYREASWDEALDKTASEIKRIQQKYGRDSVAIVSTGQLMTEEFYTLGKLVRGCIGTNNYDGNTTLCMASAVSGYKRSFGSDGPPGCYEDFEHTDCLMAFGSNLPEQHPIIYWRLKEAMEKRNFPLIVVDPRVTMFAQFADIHLAITPGTDLVLLNALAHVILKEELQDQDYIDAHCNDYEAFKAMVEKYDPTTAAKICGIDEDMIRHVARIYGKANSAMSIWTMGINQSTHGSDGVCAINNLNLITGNIGKEGGTSLSITGQCNAMGTREWSACSGLPGYRMLEKEKDRNEIAEFWNVDADFFPPKVGLKETDIFPAIESGQIKALWIIATNPMTSMPNLPRIRKTLEKLEFMVVQDGYRDAETTQYSHVYLPAAVWGEKEGVLTNTERRVNLANQFVQPPGDSKSDLWIFNQLAKRWDVSQQMSFPSVASDVFDEMAELSKGDGRTLHISGMNHKLIEEQRGIQWPMKEGESEGSKRLYTDGHFQTPNGRANLMAMDYIENNEVPCEQFPFWMNSGRVVEHFHTRTKTGKLGNLNKYSPTPYMEINPDAAEKMGIRSMDYVRLVSRRGDAVVMAQLTHRVPRNMVFIPFHFHDCVNHLSLGLLDPYSRQPAFKQFAVKIEKVDQLEAAQLNASRRTF
ncbi:nitrate reductase (quinol-dependent) catalytic subunit [Sinobacterium caligoides]|uniref:Nitrate reductase (Quinol-dependent) catalytic subunit n=1 Tax=Sinobacterium caligoides TaxID=933926 RepID=A0A3N2DPT6_9GAMM|nr:nitrate reductase [Sinobacterium caligoides]ROS01813.1 nitrate reductase (quinol-dependent) catalytic subunit [Sinobacterium caligoides]